MSNHTSRKSHCQAAYLAANLAWETALRHSHESNKTHSMYHAIGVELHQAARTKAAKALALAESFKSSEMIDRYKFITRNALQHTLSHAGNLVPGCNI